MATEEEKWEKERQGAEESEGNRPAMARRRCRSPSKQSQESAPFLGKESRIVSNIKQSKSKIRINSKK